MSEAPQEGRSTARDTVDEAELGRAQRGDRSAFGRMVEPLRPALHAHCYRMLGSLSDADDAVQETLLRAWRGMARFEARGLLRSWLYTVATRVCLDQAARQRRVLPADLGPPSGAAATAAEPLADVRWIDPYPGPGPEAQLERREAVTLAVVAALQHLPANQRAALLLFDVVGLSAAEIAETMETSVASVNSALQRARKLVEGLAPGPLTGRHLPEDTRIRELAEAFGRSLARCDAEGLLALLTRDVTWSMPPFPAWYAGLPAVADFARRVPLATCGSWRYVALEAGGEPAVAFYLRRGETGPYAAWSLTVLGLRADRVATITSFLDPALFPAFGLPANLW